METRSGIELLGPDGETFRVGDRLGKGYFGEVYRAVGEQSGLEVAIKMLPTDELYSASTIRVRSFLNEQKGALLQIRHPNVVSYLYIDEGSNLEIGPYIILEYVTGGTLLSFLESARESDSYLSMSECLRLMTQIALGSQSINEHLIHRDIKPDNILLVGEREPVVKICDLGIAKAALEGTRLETFKGIQHLWYMAPEVIQQGTNTTKIDTYSVGLVFYEILSFEHPLLKQISDVENQFEWQDAHLHKQCQDIRLTRTDVPRHIAKLLLRMTDKSPNVRPSWEEVLRTLSIESTSISSLGINLDPSIIRMLEDTAEAKFKDEQLAKARALDEKKKASEARIRSSQRRSEIAASQLDLLSSFDEMINHMNLKVPDYQFEIEQESKLRKYTLPTKRSIVVSLLAENWIEVMYGESTTIQSVGVMAIEGALSFNLVLQAPANNVYEGSWIAVGARVSGIMSFDGRDTEYAEAGVDKATALFMETFNEHIPWQSNISKYFAFRNMPNFVRAYTNRGFSSFSFQQLDVITSFSELIKMAIKMP